MGYHGAAVEVTQQATFGASRERVWLNLLDFEVLARTLPGLDSLEPITPDKCEISMSVLVPSITGTYRGQIDVVEKNEPHSYRLIGEARGRLGWVRGDARFALSSTENGTAVDAVLAFQAGGMLASVGQRFVEATARSILKQFFSAFARELADVRA